MAHSTKPLFSKDERDVIAARVVDGGEVQAHVARDLGLNKGTLNNWVKSLIKRRKEGTAPSLLELQVLAHKLKGESDDNPSEPEPQPVPALVRSAGAPPLPVESPAEVTPQPDSESDPRSESDVIDPDARWRDVDAACVAYIDWQARPKSKRTAAQLRALIERAADLASREAGVARLAAVQARLDLTAELTEIERISPEKAAELRDGFVAHGAEWCRRRGYSIEALREVGVPRSILRRAKIAGH